MLFPASEAERRGFANSEHQVSQQSRKRSVPTISPISKLSTRPMCRCLRKGQATRHLAFLFNTTTSIASEEINMTSADTTAQIHICSLPVPKTVKFMLKTDVVKFKGT